MKITFRPFTRHEFAQYEEWSIGSYAEALIRSGTETKADALAVSAEEFEELLPDGLDTPDNFLYYAENEYGENVGFVWLTFIETDDVCIGDFGVSPDYRAQGYGGAILRALEHMLSEKGVRRLSTHVFDCDITMLRLYKDCGFTQYAHRDPASSYWMKEF